MIHDTTRSLLEAIALDTWPTVAAQVDFGVTSQRHYEALYYAVRGGRSAPRRWIGRSATARH